MSFRYKRRRIILGKEKEGIVMQHFPQMNDNQVVIQMLNKFHQLKEANHDIPGHAKHFLSHTNFTVYGTYPFITTDDRVPRDISCADYFKKCLTMAQEAGVLDHNDEGCDVEMVLDDQFTFSLAENRAVIEQLHQLGLDQYLD